MVQYLYSRNFFDEDFILNWNDKKMKLDKKCMLYDKKAEKKFREVISKVIEWLRNAESDEESSDEDEEEESKAVEKKEETAEEKARKEQQELIRKQQVEQEQKLKEKQKEQTMQKAGGEDEDSKRVDIAAVDVGDEEEDLDIDNI